MTINFLLFSLSFIFSLISYKILIPFLAKYSLDIPNQRSSHISPKPTSGGLLFVTLSSLYSLISHQYIFFICFPLAIIGFLDDRFNLPSLLRFSSQIITSIFVIKNLNLFNDIQIPISLKILLFFFLIFFVTSLINFSNFIDGIDGILSISIFIIFVTLSGYSSINLWVLNGSLLGFIYWNRFPSKIFMGDVGSTFLGAIYAYLVLSSPSLIIASEKLLLGSPIFLDTISCIFYRVKNKQNIFTAHKLHLYQRLTQIGWNHNKVVVLYASCILINCFLFIFTSFYILLFSSLIQLVVGYQISRKIGYKFN